MNALSIILSIVSTIIQTTPEAMALWKQLQAIISSNRDPNPDEWAAITAQMVAVHHAVQGTTA